MKSDDGVCLSLGIRFEGNVHVMEHPWRVATFILDSAVRLLHSHRSSHMHAAVTPPRHPSEVKQIIIQVCIRIDQLKHG